MMNGQTVGELRTRTERYHEFADLEAVESVLHAMATDDPPLVIRRDRQPGQKEARWEQLLTAEPPGGAAASPGRTDTPPDRAATEVSRTGGNDLEQRIVILEARIEEIERQLGL